MITKENPYILNRAEVFPLMRKAFLEERLAIQRGSVGCDYRTSSGPCVIGAALPDDVAEQFDSRACGPGSTIGALIRDGLVVTDCGAELMTLQARNDNFDIEAVRKMLFDGDEQ